MQGFIYGCVPKLAGWGALPQQQQQQQQQQGEQPLLSLFDRASVYTLLQRDCLQRCKGGFALKSACQKCCPYKGQEAEATGGRAVRIAIFPTNRESSIAIISS
jgi:hypothetical protein